MTAMQSPQPNDNSQPSSEKPVEQIHVHHGKNQMVAGGDITGNHIGHFGDVYGPQPLQIEYSTEQTPMLILGKSIHIPTVEKWAFWTGCLTFLGMVADCLGVLGFFGVSGKEFLRPLTPVFWASFFVVAFAILIWHTCKSLRNGCLRQFFGNWVMREDKNQRLTVGKLSATCPIPTCGGRIMLKPLFEGSRELIGKCDKYPEQHNFSFDPSTMSGSYYQIISIFPI
jgi:hypothetical protein